MTSRLELPGKLERLLVPVRPGAFRLFLALAVFFHHTTSFAIGRCAVFIFFALSGFWVERMWNARYRHTRHKYLTYIVSRLWRLAPSFALVGIIITLFRMAISLPADIMSPNNPVHMLVSSIIVLGYAQLDYLPIGPGWSLDVEMQYYLIAPMLGLVARRVGVLPTLAAVAILSIVAGSLGFDRTLPMYLIFFSLGMSAAIKDWQPGNRLAFSAGAASLLVILLITLSPWRGLLIGGSHLTPLFGWNLTTNIVLALLALPFAIYTTRQRSDAADRMMADLSYVVYLLHWIVFIGLGVVGGSMLHRLPYAVLTWVLVIPTSWLIWRFYDRPINHARSRWVASRTHSAVDTVEREVAAP